jgi:hypothetical protein
MRHPELVQRKAFIVARNLVVPGAETGEHSMSKTFTIAAAIAASLIATTASAVPDNVIM